MSSFEDREKEFETRFKHDLELQFKIKARRNRLIGMWAAGRMGMTGDAAKAYAEEIVDAQFRGGSRQVVAKLVTGLEAKGQGTTAAQVQIELEHLEAEARQQVMGE